MVFNGKGPEIPNWRPSIHDRDIVMVSRYCYLGIIISSTGKFRQATDSLYRKGLGAYFSLRSTIDRRFVDASCLNKLFNTLVKPILLYGCQVWAPVLPTVNKVLSTFSKFHNLDHALSHIAKQQLLASASTTPEIPSWYKQKGSQCYSLGRNRLIPNHY